MADPRHHVLDVYDAHLHRATDRRQWSTLRRELDFLEKKAPGSAGFSQFATWEPRGGGLTEPHLVLWINVKQHTTEIDLIDTAAHEATHAAGQLLEHVGHQIRGTDEPHAYLVGWLTRWLLDGLLTTSN